MKFAAASVLALVGSTSGFVPQDGCRRVGTEIFAGPKSSYGASRWSPQTGARPMTVDASGAWTAPAAGAGSYATPSTPVSAAPVSAVPVAPRPVMAEATRAVSSGPKSSYGVSRWGPQTGSRPMTLDASGKWTPPDAGSTPVNTYSASVFEVSGAAKAPVSAAPVFAAASSGPKTTGPKSSYGTTRWSPQTGARPMTLDASGKWTPPSADAPSNTAAYAPISGSPVANVAAPVQAVGPKSSYGTTRWSPQTGSRPMTLDASGKWTPPSAVAPSSSSASVAAAPAKPATPVVTSSVGPKSSYGTTRWSPQTGSRPMALDASGKWTPPSAVAPSSSSASVARAHVVQASVGAAPAIPVAPVVTSTGPKSSYGTSRWSPQTGSRPMTLDASGKWTPPSADAPVASVAKPAYAPAQQAPVKPVTVAAAAPNQIASKPSYSATRWSPQTGSRPMTMNASGSWTPPKAGAVGATPAAASYTAPPTSPARVPATAPPAPTYGRSAPVTAATTSGPKKSYSVSKWSPKTGATTERAPPAWSPAVNGAVNGVNGHFPAVEETAKSAGAKMHDLSREWAMMNGR